MSTTLLAKTVLLLTALLYTANTVCALENGLARTPPMGWLAWERFLCQTDCHLFPDTCISEFLFKTMAYQLAEVHKLHELGYVYVNIDDCWSEKSRAPQTERLVPDTERFPSGIIGVADYVHSLGLKVGLYGDCGDATCGGYPAQLRPNSSDDFFKTDAETFAEWKIDSFKLDGCYIDPKVAEERCPAFSTAMQATNRQMLLVCEWPFYMMYSDDPVNWQLVADKCNIWRYYDDIEDSWDSIENTIDYTVAMQDMMVKVHGPGHWFDPDQLTVGNFGLSPSQEAAQMAIWSVWAAPLYMSNDLRSISESSLAILKNKNLIAVNQDKLGVLGLQTQRTFVTLNDDGISYKMYHQAFVKPVLPVTGACPSFAVVYLNRDRIGSGNLVSYNVRQLLVGAKLALEQAEKHAKEGSDQSAHFNALSCLEALGDDKKSYEFKVFDLLASSEFALELEPVKAADDLSLLVKPVSVRAVKLIMNMD